MRFLISTVLCLILPLFLYAQRTFEQERETMVKNQIQARGISDPATLEAMRAVARHEFVPEELVARAYQDSPLPIGFGQTISQPYIVAYMTELVSPRIGQKVLEIGTGSGYQAAVLARIVDSVFTVEIISELGHSAAARLTRLGYDNVAVAVADGYFGWDAHAPYDAIVVTAAAEFIPPPLVEQLKTGGKMIIPIGSPFRVQTLMLVEKTAAGVKTRSLIPVRFVPFTRSE
ncbi:MAG: protein-L-isoaspartate(D-aspartate) O-methyltransferase [Ignavibacteriales bacterium]|nr:protein-L-isoaspartate(D-aspartate) O-methyltransferase [Ignavibacteriales bacterium]